MVSFSPRRFAARSHGLWARQRTSCVWRGPQVAYGAPPSNVDSSASPVGGSSLVFTAPEKLAAATNSSGWRAGYVMAPKPPIDSPAVARPLRHAAGGWWAALHGLSWGPGSA